MIWQVAAGHGNIEGLVDMVQEPALPRGIEYPELRFAASGSATWHGAAFGDLEWNVLLRMPADETPSQRDQLLTQFGLSDTVASGPVTVRLRNNSGVVALYNATAILLSPGTRAQGRWERLVIRLRALVAIQEPEPP